jgi:mRNA interferase MazF
MRRGDVWYVDLDPAEGSEANKTRRCVIVSNNARNLASQRSGRGVVTVVPLTKNTGRVLDFQALIPAEPGNGLEFDSKAQCEQVRSVDIQRLSSRLGSISREHLAAIEQGLLIHLDLL